MHPLTNERGKIKEDRGARVREGAKEGGREREGGGRRSIFNNIDSINSIVYTKRQHAHMLIIIGMCEFT